MKTFSVSVAGLNKNTGTLRPVRDTFKFTPSSPAVKAGLIPSPAIIRDLVNAAVYLSRESAAISCTCCGYTVSK